MRTPRVCQVGTEPSLVIALPREAPSTPPATGAGDGSGEYPPGTGGKSGDRPYVSLLGPLTVRGAKQSRRGLRAHALELIALLALRRQGAQRDEILEALWPGDDPKRSRHRLYQAARDARRLLGDAVASERDRYWLDRGLVRVDVDDLDELLDRAREVGRGGRQRELIQRALMLFRAEPLAGSDFPWCDGEVRRLRGIYVDLLNEVGRAHCEVGEDRESLDAAERGLAVDVLNEELWRLAMQAEFNLGLREAVSARYESLRKILDERLGIEPDRETRALYRELLSQQ
jgi:two-component SAPR family response regulator